MHQAFWFARPRLAPAFGALGVASAYYLFPASVHIVAWNGLSAVRVAMLPPASRLAWAAVIALVVTGLAVVLWRRTQGSSDDLIRLTAPLSCLWIWWIPFLPWLPARVPLLLMLAGPLRWGAVALAVIGCARAVLQMRGGLRARPDVSGRTVFMVSLIVLLLLGIHVKRVRGVRGDEPSYLIVTHSLLVDRDLQIENNHLAHHYSEFFPDVLPPQFLRRGANGAIYSIHAPGLPVLLLPFYAAAGQWGALVFMVLLAALAARAVFELAARLASREVAFVTWIAFAFSIPFGLQSSLIFPEIPAALVMAWSAQWLWTPVPERVANWVWRGTALALLPWLHTKFVLLLVVVAVWMAVRLRWRPKLAAAFLGPLVASIVGWLSFFYLIYGTPNPTVVYGYAQGAGLQLSNIPRGILGLFMDQEYGLLWYSPVYALAVVGVWVMLRRGDLPWPAVAIVLTVAAFLGATTQYYMWWGGVSVPARFLVPVLPLLAPLVAVALQQLRSHAGRALAALAVGLSVATFAVVVVNPEAALMYNDRDGTGRLLEWLQGGAPLTATLPSFIQPDWAAQLPKQTVWMAAVLGAVGVTLVARRRTADPFASAVVAVLAFGASGSLLAIPLLTDETRALASREGKLRLLAAFDGPRVRVVDLEGFEELTPDELFARAAVTEGARLPEDGNPGRVAGPFSLTAGRYDVWVGFNGRSPDTLETVRATFGGGPGFLAHGSVSSDGRPVIPLDLPLALSSVWVGSSDLSVARSIGVVRIVPRSIVPKSQRERVGRVRAAHQVAPGVSIFYLDEGTFPEEEGYWVRGGASGGVLVAPGRAPALAIRLQNGATAGAVSVSIAGEAQELRLSAWESRELHLPRSGQLLVPIVISAREGFRPSEVDPQSDDQRWLGCRVQVVPVETLPQ